MGKSRNMEEGIPEGFPKKGGVSRLFVDDFCLYFAKKRNNIFQKTHEHPSLGSTTTGRVIKGTNVIGN